VTRQVTGSGYHDHNWGNVSPANLFDTGGGGAAESATTRSLPLISVANAAVGGTRIPLFFVGDDHHVQVNAYGSDVSAVEGRAPYRHPDPKHVRPIGSGVSYVTADGSRAEFKISDRLLKSSNLLSDQSFIIRTAAAITSKSLGIPRFESPITLKLPGQSQHQGEGTLEFFELK